MYKAIQLTDKVSYLGTSFFFALLMAISKKYDAEISILRRLSFVSKVYTHLVALKCDSQQLPLRRDYIESQSTRLTRLSLRCSTASIRASVP